ncbi:MAG: DNA-directed RNA polymerase, subunit E'' [Candidatus Thermoplasmatota archaeon]|nr:DNA-directed RNA polymerase, subunit E'' [Candidatus Thermoplasmatota archaeon]
MKQLFACKNCHWLTKEKVCPHCAVPTSKRWRGYVIIEEPDRSQIAERMNIKKPGRYALKVR